jgi:hypothetical protein
MSIGNKNLEFIMGSYTTSGSVVNDVVILSDGTNGYYFASDLPSGETLDAITGISFSAITNGSLTAPASDAAADAYSALSLGGSGKTLTIPYQVIEFLAENGLNFSENAEYGTKFYDVEIADGTSVKITSDEDFSTLVSTTNPGLEPALESMLASGASYASKTVVPEDNDPSGDYATAITTLVGKLNDYTSATDTTDPTKTTATSALVTELAKAVADPVVATDPINKLQAAVTANAGSEASFYAFLDRSGASDTSGLLFHREHDKWVEVISASDAAGLATALLNDTEDGLKSGYEILEIGLFDDHEYNPVGTVKEDGFATLSARLIDDGLLGVAKNNQTGMILDDYNKAMLDLQALSSDSVFELTAHDLHQTLTNLGYNPAYDTNGDLLDSWFEVDVTNQNTFWFDAEIGMDSLDGVQFSGDIELYAYNLGEVFELDLSGNDFTSSTKITIDTSDYNPFGHVELTGVLDPDVKITVTGNRTLDITQLAATSMPKGWFVEEGASLQLTNTQLLAIQSGRASGTDYDFDGKLHIFGDNSSTAETINGTSEDDVIHADSGANTIIGAGGNDSLYAGDGVDTFKVGYSDGNDRIYGFDFDNDKLIFADNAGTPVETEFTFSSTYFNALTSADYDIEGNLVIDSTAAGSTASVTLVNPSYDNPLTITEVDGKRWGDYVTFKVSSEDFTGLEALDFKMSWDTNDFVYVDGSLDDSNSFIANDPGSSASLTDAGIINLSDVHVGEISVGMLSTNPIGITSANNEAFTFMLKRIDPNPSENFIQFDYVISREEIGGVTQDEEVSAGGKFGFDYVTDDITVKGVTHAGNVIPNPDILVATSNVQDGLSIVPIATYGKFTQYEVVYNLSYPTAYLNASLDSPTYTLSLDAPIVSGSVTSGTDGKLFAELPNAAIVPGDVTVSGATSALMTGTNQVQAWDQIFAMANTTGVAEPSVSVDSTGLDFTFSPGSTGGVNSLTLDDPTDDTDNTDTLSQGRYSIATFIAADDGSPFEYDTMDGGRQKTIKLLHRDASASELISTNGKTFTIDDGSEIFVLGDKWYENPETYTRAITSSDALDALNISTGTSATNVEIIAADVDKSGSVTAFDAYAILQYAANSSSNVANYKPEWFYIDAVSTPTLDYAEFNYDYAIDKFVGKTGTINATGVLLGDVTGSYSILQGFDDPISNVAYMNTTDVNPNATGGNVSGAANNKYQIDVSSGFEDIDGNPLSSTDAVVLGSINATQASIDLDAIASGSNVIKVMGQNFTDANNMKSTLDGKLKATEGSTFIANDEILLMYSTGSQIKIAVLEITAPANQSTGFQNSDYTITDKFTLTSSVSDLTQISATNVEFTNGASNNNSITEVNVTSGETKIALVAAEKFVLPVSTSAEILKFSSSTSVGDMVVNFESGTDEIQVDAGGSGATLVKAISNDATVVTSSDTSVANVVSAIAGASGLVAASSGNVGVALVAITDWDQNTSGDQGAQMLAFDIDEDGFDAADVYIILEAGTFSNLSAVMGDVALF